MKTSDGLIERFSSFTLRIFGFCDFKRIYSLYFPVQTFLRLPGRLNQDSKPPSPLEHENSFQTLPLSRLPRISRLSHFHFFKHKAAVLFTFRSHERRDFYQSQRITRIAYKTKIFLQMELEITQISVKFTCQYENYFDFRNNFCNFDCVVFVGEIQWSKCWRR